MSITLNPTLPRIGDRTQAEEYPYDIFQVGDRAHEKGWSDVMPCTVVKVDRGGTRVTVRMDEAELDPEGPKPEWVTGGFVGHCTNQRSLEYIFTENPEGALKVFTLRKWRGRYVWTPADESPDGIQRLGKGWRRFYDYNF